MSVTNTIEGTQANLFSYLRQLDNAEIDKVIIQDDNADLAVLVTNAIYVAADPGAADMIVDAVGAYSHDYMSQGRLYKMVKNLRDQESGGALAQKATCSITAIAAADITDTETFTLVDAFGVDHIFEFDKGGGVTPPNVQVDISGATTAEDVAAIIDAAVAGEGFGTSTVGAVTTVTQIDPGDEGNQANSDTVVNASFVITNFTGGADAPASVGVQVIGLKTTKNDADPRAVLVPAAYAAEIGLL